MTATVVLLGVRGFGAVHLANIERLAAAGRVRLVACVDPVVHAEGQHRIGDAPLFRTLADAIAGVGVPDVVVIAVPIHLHAPLAAEALRAGSDVLLEKPPFARMRDLADLLRLERETGRRVQVGFQSLGSHAIEAIRRDEYGIGPIRHVRAMGTWSRRRGYWSRSPWAGRRHLDGVDVVDGVVTNPLAHAVATALRIAGVDTAADVERVDVDAYRTNPIDADDTTALRIVPAHAGRPTISAALTLSAASDDDPPPLVEVVGESGTISFRYTLDEVVLTDGTTVRTGRSDLLEDLADHRETGRPLLVPLESTGAFMRVVEAVRTGPAPTRIEERFVRTVGEADDARPVLQDVESWIRAAADRDGTFVDAGAPWATARRDRVVARAGTGAGGPLLTVQDGGGTAPSSSPRPFLHPVRTRGGVELTAVRPADHDWHLGLGFTIPDVAGTNFWGGGTYAPDTGYRLLGDHGVQRLTRVEHDGDDESGSISLRLDWLGRDGAHVLTERRTTTWRALDESTWRLLLRSELDVVEPVDVHTPGTRGRGGAGYGGWFWRFPPCRDIEVRTDAAKGEDAVNGSIAPWLSWSAHFDGTPGATGDATVLLQPGDDGTAADPWFVRTSAYPGVGSAIAWDRPMRLEPGVTTSRSLSVSIADGRLGPEEIGRLV